MVSLLLANIAFSVNVLATIFLLRIKKGKRYLSSFYSGYALAIIFFSLTYLLAASSIISDLAFVFDYQATVAGYIYGIIVLTLLCFCYVNFVYAGALTGVTTQILCIIRLNTALPIQELIVKFHPNARKVSILDERLHFLLERRYVIAEGSRIRLTKKGKFVLRIRGFLIRLFRTDDFDNV